MKTYAHPQETWDETECEKRSRSAPADHWGNRPPRGIIASSASNCAQYGQTLRYNGGKIIDGKLYQAEHRPLPKIPDAYEFYQLSSWGTVIRKANKKEVQ